MSIPFIGAGGCRKELPLCREYKYVGTFTTISKSMIPEINNRTQSVFVAMEGLNPRFLRLPNVPQNAKSHVLNMVLLTRCLFNAGVWPSLQTNELRRLHAAFLKVMRTVAGFERPCHGADNKWISDENVILHLKALPHRFLLMVQRLSLVVRIFSVRHPALLRILWAAQGTNRSWVASFIEDVHLIATHSDVFF